MVMEAYRLFPAKDSFFIMPKSGTPKQFLQQLAGNATLMQQIKEGKSEARNKKNMGTGIDPVQTNT